MTQKAKPLPFEPETLPAARARYLQAIWPLYNIHAIQDGRSSRPSLKREHVFDFKTGLRLIISREWAPLNPPDDRGPFLHVSAGWARSGLLNGKQLPIGEVVRTFYYISRSNMDREPLWSYVTENRILHLLYLAPFEHEYAWGTPLEAIHAHELHIELGVQGEEKTVQKEFFDPRLHCSICTERVEKRSS